MINSDFNISAPGGGTTPDQASATTDLSDLQIGDMVVATADTHEVPKRRPFYVYSLYYDDSGHVTGFDALDGTTLKPTRKRIYPHDLVVLKGELINSKHEPEKELVIGTNDLTAFSASDNIDRTDRRIHHNVWPDILLRRAAGLLYAKNVEYTMASATSHNGITNIRRGFYFNNIGTNDLRYKDAFTPDITSTIPSSRQNGLPDLVEQNDVEMIAKMTRHYVDYCFKNRLHVIWDDVGYFDDWDDEFYAFAEPRDIKDIGTPYWLADQQSYRSLRKGPTPE